MSSELVTDALPVRFVSVTAAEVRESNHRATPLPTTRRGARNMTARLSLHLLLVVLPGLIAIPEPGRIPKVYNALITSNQNLEPSKAYPVYQPVLHDAFPFPFQPLFYGGSFPFTTGLLSAPALLPKDPTAHPATAAPSSESAPDTKAPSNENVTPAPEETNQDTQAKSQSTPVPPPPATQSPIPLNEFGLPPQVLPLGRFNPAYSGFNHIGPYALPYPNFRFYDPYDPFNLSFGSYPNTPLVYGPLTNVLGQSTPVLAGRESDSTGTASPGAPQTPQTPSQTPPAEPSNLNVLNFSSSDPNIPNVPPPPLPQGGLKPDKTE